MLGDKRLFDDMARVATGAAGALGGFKSRVEGELRDQVERLLSRMNLVTREEFEIVAAVAQKARAEQEVLAERIAALEASLAVKAATAPKASRRAAAARPGTATKPKPAGRRRGQP